MKWAMPVEKITKFPCEYEVVEINTNVINMRAKHGKSVWMKYFSIFFDDKIVKIKRIDKDMYELYIGDEIIRGNDYGIYEKMWRRVYDKTKEEYYVPQYLRSIIRNTLIDFREKIRTMEIGGVIR